MGKTTRPFPTGHLRLNPKKNASTDTPLVVQLEYVVTGRPIRRSTGYSVKSSDWDKNGNRGIGGVKASYGVDYRNLNQRLLKLIKSTDERFEKYCEANPNERLTWDTAVAIIDKAPEAREDKGIDFIDYVNELLLSERDRNKIGQSVYKNGICGMNVFGQFLIAERLSTYKEGRIYVSEISVDLVAKYITWRRKFKKNSDDTINHSLTPILKGCRKAAIEGYISNSMNNAIQGMRIITSKSLEKDDASHVRHLTEENLQSLLEYYQSDVEPRRKEYVEMFLFAMYACGLRFVDVLTLQWSHIDFKKLTINKLQVKTKNRNVIPLTPQALTILEKWKPKTGKNRFVFGLIPDNVNLDDKESLYKIRTGKTRAVNQSLEVVGESLKLPFTLSFHVARHTFAVQSLNQGMRMTVVSQLLGHTSTEMTERVYAHYIPETLYSELQKIQLPAM